MIKLTFASGQSVFLPIHDSDSESWMERFVDPNNLFEFDLNTTQHTLDHLGAQDPLIPKQIKIGVVHWPRQASAFAYAHFLATEQEKDLILAQTKDQYNASTTLSLTLDDGTGGVQSFRFYVLPPRPLSQLAPNDNSNLWLLTFVDNRYFWLSSKYNFSVYDSMSWSNAINSFTGVLNTSFQISTISSAYGFGPSSRFESVYQPTGLLLDSICQTIGLKYSHQYDGTGKVQSYPDAIASSITGSKLAGGEFDDLTRQIPGAITVIFGRKVCGTYSTQPFVLNVTLDSIRSQLIPFDARFSTVKGVGRFAIVGDADAEFSNPDCLSPNNLNQLIQYANQAAFDWYRWQLLDLDVVYSGIASINPTAAYEVIEWTYRKDMVKTRVMRPRMNDRSLGKYRVSRQGGYLSAFVDPSEQVGQQECPPCGSPYVPEDRTIRIKEQTCLTTDSAGRLKLTEQFRDYKVPRGMVPAGPLECDENPLDCCEPQQGGTPNPDNPIIECCTNEESVGYCYPQTIKACVVSSACGNPEVGTVIDLILSDDRSQLVNFTLCGYVGDFISANGNYSRIVVDICGYYADRECIVCQPGPIRYFGMSIQAYCFNSNNTFGGRSDVDVTPRLFNYINCNNLNIFYTAISQICISNDCPGQNYIAGSCKDVRTYRTAAFSVQLTLPGSSNALCSQLTCCGRTPLEMPNVLCVTSNFGGLTPFITKGAIGDYGFDDSTGNITIEPGGISVLYFGEYLAAPGFLTNFGQMIFNCKNLELLIELSNVISVTSTGTLVSCNPYTVSFSIPEIPVSVSPGVMVPLSITFTESNDPTGLACCNSGGGPIDGCFENGCGGSVGQIEVEGGIIYFDGSQVSFLIYNSTDEFWAFEGLDFVLLRRTTTWEYQVNGGTWIPVDFIFCPPNSSVKFYVEAYGVDLPTTGIVADIKWEFDICTGITPPHPPPPTLACCDRVVLPPTLNWLYFSNSSDCCVDELSGGILTLDPGPFGLGTIYRYTGNVCASSPSEDCTFIADCVGSFFDTIDNNRGTLFIALTEESYPLIYNDAESYWTYNGLDRIDIGVGAGGPFGIRVNLGSWIPFDSITCGNTEVPFSYLKNSVNLPNQGITSNISATFRECVTLSNPGDFILEYDCAAKTLTASGAISFFAQADETTCDPITSLFSNITVGQCSQSHQISIIVTEVI